jgi:RNA polymerase-binding transcription factor
MNKKQLKSFELRLRTMEVEINTLLGRTSEDSKPVDLDLPIGRLSRADAIQMQNMAELNRRQLEIKLKQIEGALSAFEAGSYGSCRSCNGEINPARLDARPETPFCIDCQEAFEMER